MWVVIALNKISIILWTFCRTKENEIVVLICFFNKSCLLKGFLLWEHFKVRGTQVLPDRLAEGFSLKLDNFNWTHYRCVDRLGLSPKSYF